MLLNLPKFPSGYLAALNRIPEERGVYAFFPYYCYPDDPDDLYSALVAGVERKKFADRKASIVPYYAVTLESKTGISPGKLPQLKEALKNDAFRKDLIETLGNSLLFQSPLYLGKSKNIRGRIRQHLEGASDLRDRLLDAGYSIESTSILIIPSANDISSEINEGDDIDSDGLAEEVLSRLFHINFNIRLG